MQKKSQKFFFLRKSSYLCSVDRIDRHIFGSVWLYSELMNLDNSSEHRNKVIRSSPFKYIYMSIYASWGVDRYLIVSRQSRAYQLVS